MSSSVHISPRALGGGTYLNVPPLLAYSKHPFQANPEILIPMVPKDPASMGHHYSTRHESSMENTITTTSFLSPNRYNLLYPVSAPQAPGVIAVPTKTTNTAAYAAVAATLSLF